MSHDPNPTSPTSAVSSSQTAVDPQVQADLEKEVQAGIDKLKEALKGSDLEAIKSATEEVRQPLYELSAAAYQQAQQAAGAAGAAPGADANAGAQSAPQDDNVVDAEFTEVKDDKK